MSLPRVGAGLRGWGLELKCGRLARPRPQGARHSAVSSGVFPDAISACGSVAVAALAAYVPGVRIATRIRAVRRAQSAGGRAGEARDGTIGRAP
jgi:hypothetical protein